MPGALDRITERYSHISGDPEKFAESLKKPLKKSFRVNTLKANTKEVVKSFRAYGIPVEKAPFGEGFVTDDKRITSTLEYFLGHIYVQELVSMLPATMVKKEIVEDSLILDACAAPGSKTTHLSALMENTGLIVANDSDYQRLKALKHNLEKVGSLNAVVTNNDARYFRPGLQFDIALLDAPCTSEGTLRKNPSIADIWSEKRISGISNLQKQLMTNCFDQLRPGGFLVYSTCTFAPEENEEVVDYLLRKREYASLEKISINGLKTASGILEWNGKEFSGEVKKTVRIWPHMNDTGGFFLAKIRKAEK